MWASWGPMCQAKALPGLTGVGNVDTFGADSLVEGVVEDFGVPRGVFQRFALEASIVVIGSRSEG
jgi:hypothetical protein